jgi:hypothetical protein
MKTLYESLLDDLDDLIDASDKNVKHTEVNNPDFISSYGGGWKVIGDTAVISDSNYTGRRTRRYYNEYPHIRISQKSIDEWLGTNEVRVENTGLYLEGSIISKDTFSKKIIIDDKYKQSLHIFGNHLTIKDINIETNGSLGLASDDQILVSNSIMNVSNNHMVLNIHSRKIPEFNKFKSNIQRMNISDTFMFDGWENRDAVSQIDNHLALPYTIKVKDNKKNEEVEVKIKSFKKIHAIINNRKRYTPMEPVLRFKPGFKITDLIDISGCKKLTELNIYNNLVELKFVKRAYPQYALENINYVNVGDWIVSIYKR